MQIKKINTEIKWVMIFVVMTLAWMLLERVAGLHDTHIDKHMIYTNFIAIPAVAVYVLALLDKRKRDFNGIMSYKQGFISGLIITAIVTVLSPLTQAITSLLITPDYFRNVIDYTVSQDIKSREEAEKYFSLGNYIVQGLIGAPVMGIITTAIVAIFTRSKPR
ncbi:MAG: DUF4199 domain-containing protein [Lentimicrobium sp.]|nr:DUF4199 domain-containing protein [Lentimicrobium sp.]